MARYGTSYMQPPIMDPYAAMLGEEGETVDGMMAPEQADLEQPVQPMDYPRAALFAPMPPASAPEVVPVRNPEPYRAAAAAPAPPGQPFGVDVYRAPEYGPDMDLDALRQAQETARRRQMIGGFFAAGMKDRRRGADLRQSIAQQANAPVNDLLARRRLYRDRYEAGQKGERARMDDARAQSRTDTLNAATRQKMAKLEQEAARLEALRDPTSPESQRARDTFARVAPSMADRMGDSMSAADIQELMQPGFKSELRRREIELQNEGRAEVARIKAAAKRRGGGGGSSRVQRNKQYLMEQFGLDETQADIVARDEVQMRKFAPGGAMAASDGIEALSETFVPGYGATDVPLTPPEQRAMREANAATNNLEQAAARMVEISKEASAAEKIGSRAKLTELTAEARQQQERISIALRNIGNYGVPQATELARMERLAPQLQTWDGLINAGRLYGALGKTQRQLLETKLKSYGYDVKGAKERKERANRMVTVRRRSDGAEVQMPMSEARKLKADLYELVQ